MNTLNHIRNFLRIDDRLSTSGMPKPSDFAALRQAGFEVVINLAMPTSDNAMPNEGDLVSVQGMTYVHIPVNFESPQSTYFEQFTKMMNVCVGQKSFLSLRGEHACVRINFFASTSARRGSHVG
ncbi:MAG: hypothetical protein ABI042_10980 [Verrucomicrobiota bacterium]